MVSIFTLPNMLSASRIVLLPLLFFLLYSGRPHLFLLAYIIIGSTDFFDGLAARKLNQVTKFGKELDSIADLLFYISSAYFLFYLYPEVVKANWTFLIIFFSILGTSFIVSGILFRRPVMMHTTMLRLSAAMVYFVVIFSFLFDTTLLVRLVILVFSVGFIEEIIIFMYFGNVDPDTKSIFHLVQEEEKTVDPSSE